MRVPNEIDARAPRWPLALFFAPTLFGVGSVLGNECPESHCARTQYEIVLPGGGEDDSPVLLSPVFELEGGSRELTFSSLPPSPRPEADELPFTSNAVSRAASPRSRYDWSIGTLNPDHDDHYPYRLPYGNGVTYPVLQGYGSRLSHQGPEFFTVDFEMPEGTPVHAAREGLVALIEETNSEGCWAEHCGQLANYVVILHADGTTGEYFHLQQAGVLVSSGEHVAAGQLIAISGNTGYTTIPHLHFGVYSARARGRTQSIGVRFRTRSGLVRELRSGARHLNAD